MTVERTREDFIDLFFLTPDARKLKTLTDGGLTPGVLLQLILLDAVIGPLAEGGDAGNGGERVRGRGVEVQVERAQQGGGRLAAGGRGAAVGDGGVRPLEGGGVLVRGHGDGGPGPRLCRGRQAVSSGQPASAQ